MLAGEINRWKWEKRGERDADGEIKREARRRRERSAACISELGDMWDERVNNRHINEAK